MAQKGEVEVIPWRHEIEGMAHEKAVEFIRNMPKNSNLGIEMSHQTYNIVSWLMDTIAGKSRTLHLSGNEERRWAKKYHNSPKATTEILSPYIEIFHECKKRNIRVLPIETSESRDVGAKKVVDAIGIKKTNQLREKIMADEIGSFLRNSGEKKMVALMGFNHVDGISSHLEREGFNVRRASLGREVDAEFARNIPLAKKYMDTKDRHASEVELLELDRQINFAFRTESSNQVIARLTEELRKPATIRKFTTLLKKRVRGEPIIKPPRRNLF